MKFSLCSCTVLLTLVSILLPLIWTFFQVKHLTYPCIFNFPSLCIAVCALDKKATFPSLRALWCRQWTLFSPSSRFSQTFVIIQVAFFVLVAPSSWGYAKTQHLDSGWVKAGSSGHSYYDKHIGLLLERLGISVCCLCGALGGWQVKNTFSNSPGGPVKVSPAVKGCPLESSSKNQGTKFVHKLLSGRYRRPCSGQREIMKIVPASLQSREYCSWP